MNAEYQLKYFDRVVYIDPNQRIHNELEYFSAILDDQIRFFSNVMEAKTEITSNPELKHAIICSSKIINQIIQNLRTCTNCFCKPIVFCGSYARCDEVKKNYKFQISGVECQGSKVILKLAELEARLNLIESKATLKAVWLIQKQLDRIKIQREFGGFINKLQFECGLHVTFRTEQELSDFLEYSQEMEKHLKVLVIADNRTNKWPTLYPQIQANKQKFTNVIDWLVYRLGGQSKQDFVSEITSFEELEAVVLSLVEWQTL